MVSLRLPEPDLQIAFSSRLLQARQEFLQEALLRTLSDMDVKTLDAEVHQYVPSDGLRVMVGHGLRAEMVFALPSVLKRNPRLIAYYRLVLGFSRKEIYSRSPGMSEFQQSEDHGTLSARQEAALPHLCVEINRVASMLVQAIAPKVTAQLLDDLSLLTYGPQLRGGRNVSLGTDATGQVFEVIRKLIGSHALEVTEKHIIFADSTGRTVEVRFSNDPDIAVASVKGDSRSPMLAIEIKGGTDLSNIHNRLGEAEKSHLKAKERGFNELWTVLNVRGLSEEALRRGSPTTTRFIDLADIVTGEGPAHEAFKELLLEKLRLPESG